jgi:regulator of nonsense transcripts 1
MERKPRKFAQALIDAGNHDDDCSIYIIPYDDLKYEDLEHLLSVSTPHGLSVGYWKDSGKLAALAVVSAKRGVVIEFPEPPRRPASGSSPAVNTDRECYQVLVNFLASQPAGEFFAFDVAPLSMTLYVEQGLRLTNAVDIQSAFPTVNRYSIAAILKAALGDTKIWESNLSNAFDNIIYDPDVYTAYLEPVKRAWLAQYLGSVGDAITTYCNVERVNTVDMDVSVSRFNLPSCFSLNLENP